MRRLRDRAVALSLTAVVLGLLAQPPFDQVATLALVITVGAGLVAEFRLEDD